MVFILAKKEENVKKSSKNKVEDVEIIEGNEVEEKSSKKTKTTKEKESKEKKPRKKTRRQRRLKDEITHSYIPDHRVLDEEEILKLKEERKIEVDKLPIIFLTDKALRHLEVKVGDVIEIKRNNYNVGDILYYRKVENE